jgi:RimJ/RimL family protein N-acetyltransferase
MLQLSGTRVMLRPFREDELDRLYEARQRSTTTVGSIDAEKLRERIAHSGEWFEGRLDFAIDVGGRIELFDDERGKGLGSEAVELVTEWLLRNGYPRVQASTDVRNSAMRRVLEKLGYEQEGVLRAFMPDGDRRADYVLYAITL